MVMEEKPGLIRPATYIRERGSFMSRGEEVYADVPSALNPSTERRNTESPGAGGVAGE